MSSTERLLAELNEGYVRAAENADVEWYREHLSDDYVCSTIDGAIRDKAEFLRRIAGGPVGSRYAAVDPRIHLPEARRPARRRPLCRRMGEARRALGLRLRGRDAN